jgi:hypothetical protein
MEGRDSQKNIQENIQKLRELVKEQGTHPDDLSDIQRGKTYKRIKTSKTSGTQTQSVPKSDDLIIKDAIAVEPEPAESEPASLIGLSVPTHGAPPIVDEIPAAQRRSFIRHPTTHRSRPKWRDACKCCGKDCTSKPDDRGMRRCRKCKEAGIFPPSEAVPVAVPVEDPVVERAAEAEAVAAPGSPYQRLQAKVAEGNSPPKNDLSEGYTNPLGTPQNILNQGEDDDPLDPLPPLSPPPEIATYSQLKKKKKKKKKKPKKTKKKKPKKSKKKKPKKSKKKK